MGFAGYIYTGSSNYPFGKDSKRYKSNLNFLADFSKKNYLNNIEIIEMLRRIARNSSFKENFVNQVAKTSTQKFPGTHPAEIERISYICKNVSSSLLDLISTNENGKEFSFETSPNKSIFIEYYECAEGRSFQSREKCKIKIISLISQIAPFDLISLSA